MVDKINEIIGWFNHLGDGFWTFASSMFVQVGFLVVVLLGIDQLLKHQVRAIVRYWLWTLVLVKLVLPVQLGTPLSLAYWFAPTDRAGSEVERIPVTLSVSSAERVMTSFATPAIDSHPAPPAEIEGMVPSSTQGGQSPRESDMPLKSQSATPTLRGVHWQAWAFSGWLAIVAILFGLVFRKALIVRRLVADSSDAPDELQSQVIQCAATLWMNCSARAKITSRLGSPAICGFRKPTILLPHGLSDRLDHDQLRLVFAHELAHWKRFDLQINCLQTVLQVLYFYNPAVWIANAVIRRRREEAVDETVLVALRSGANRYGNTLLDVAASALEPAELTLRLIGVVESRRLLAARIRRIVNLPIPKSARLGFAGILAIALAGLLLLPMAGKPTMAAPQNSAPATDPSSKTNSSPGTEPATQAKPAAAEPTLHGRLVDETGAPVTDAEIDINSLRTYRVVQAKSDKDGNYQFVGISEPGEYQIAINSKRWVGITDRAALPRVDLNLKSPVVRDFVLPRACRLRIQTVDETGQPIERVLVYSSLSADNQNFAAHAASDKQGRAMLEGLKPSPEPRLVATMVDGYAFARTVVTLNDPSAVVERQLILPKGEMVTGKAMCTDGKPAAGWRINAMPTWWHFGVSPTGQLIADDGSFTLPHVVPDTYNVIVSIPEGKGLSMAKPVLSDAALPRGLEPLAISIDYPSPGSMATLSGHIAFTGGQLLRGMHIMAHSSNGKYFGNGFVEPGKQDFEIGSVPRGVYTIDFQSTEIEPLTLRDVQIPSEKKLEVELKVRGVLSLRGIVVRADNQKPVTKFRAQVIKERTLSGPNYVQDSNWHEITDDEGAFKIDLTGPGIYVVQVAAEGLSLATSKQFNTDKDGESQIKIELAAGTSLAGAVVDEQGKPVNGAKVFPLPNAALMNRQTVGQLTPGEPVVETRDGKFSMPALPPGRGVIRIIHPDFAPATLDTGAPSDAPKSSTLSIVLHPGATIRGHVYDDHGQLEPNAELHFQDRSGYGGSDDEKLGRLATAVSDQNGYYEVHHLPDYYCYVLRADPWTSWGVVRQAISTKSGQTQTLDFGGTSKIAGRLIVDGNPLANAKVQLSGEDSNFGIFKAFARTDSDGAFTFWGTPPGERTLYYSTSPQNNTWVRVKTFPITAASADLGAISCTSAKLTVRVESTDPSALDAVHLELAEFNPVWTYGRSVGALLDRTDRQSPYVFDQVPPGKYELICYRPNQFTVRQIVEIAPTSRQETVTLKLPPGTASLSGKVDAAFSGPSGGHFALKMWSADQRLLAYISPQEDGTYMLENIPPGEYLIKDKDTRDAEALLKVSLADSEHKTLDITPDKTAGPAKPIGYATLYVFTPEGVPIPGCNIRFEGAANPPTLSSTQDGLIIFIGAPGTYDATISYPGFKPIHQSLDFKAATKDDKSTRNVETHVTLQPNDR